MFRVASRSSVAVSTGRKHDEAHNVWEDERNDLLYALCTHAGVREHEQIRVTISCHDAVYPLPLLPIPFLDIEAADWSFLFRVRRIEAQCSDGIQLVA